MYNLKTVQYQLRSNPTGFVSVIDDCSYKRGPVSAIKRAEGLLGNIEKCRRALYTGRYILFSPPSNTHKYDPLEIAQLITNATYIKRMITKQKTSLVYAKGSIRERSKIRYNKLTDRVFLRSCLGDLENMINRQDPQNPKTWDDQAKDIAKGIRTVIQGLGGKF